MREVSNNNDISLNMKILIKIIWFFSWSWQATPISVISVFVRLFRLSDSEASPGSICLLWVSVSTNLQEASFCMMLVVVGSLSEVIFSIFGTCRNYLEHISSAQPISFIDSFFIVFWPSPLLYPVGFSVFSRPPSPMSGRVTAILIFFRVCHWDSSDLLTVFRVICFLFGICGVRWMFVTVVVRWWRVCFWLPSIRVIFGCWEWCAAIFVGSSSVHAASSVFWLAIVVVPTVVIYAIDL